MIKGPIQILLLVGLVKLLIETEKPFVCSGIYAGAHLLFGMLLSAETSAVIVGTLISFGLASLYFWLLQRSEAGSGMWWAWLVGGLLIGLV